MTDLQLQHLDLDIVLSHVYAHATHLKSRLHGESHWLHVTQCSLMLAEQTPHCDLAVIYLFGLLHDTKRLHDGRDSQHGERASEFVQHLQHENILQLSHTQLDILTSACYDHNKGKTSEDMTIGICWDADRLNLWRVGMMPKEKYMSTHPAKQHHMRLKALQHLFKRYTWQGLLAGYITLEQAR